MTDQVKKEVEKGRELDRDRDREARIAKIRENRIPPGIPSLSLNYPQREGWTRRVVCDREGRLQKFEKGGWAYVHIDDLEGENPAEKKVSSVEGIDSRVSQVVGTHKDGRPMKGYLMEIPTEIYDEDQAIKMENLDRLERGFMAGLDERGQHPDGQYIPKTGIKVTRGQRRP